MSDRKPEDVLADWDLYMYSGADKDLAKALRQALKERDEAGGMLIRLAKACYPLDMWLAGHWTKELSDKERHAWVLALSDAYGFVQKSGDK